MVSSSSLMRFIIYFYITFTSSVSFYYKRFEDEVACVLV